MGWVNDFMDWFEPIHDKLDPADAWLQEQVIGDNEVQKQVIPMAGSAVLDFFYPGAGAALRASNDASDGNWTGAAINGALGAYGAAGGWGSAAGSTAGNGASTAESGLPATEGMQGTQALSSAGGDAAGASGTANAAGAPDYGYTNQVSNNATAGQPGYGWNYYDNGTAISPDGAYFNAGEQITGAGGQPMGLLDYAGKYAGSAGRFMASPEGGKALNSGLKTYGSIAQANAAQEVKNQMLMQQQRPQFAPMSDTPRGPVASFSQTSPYASFQGGFNPQRRPMRRGLLG